MYGTYLKIYQLLDIFAYFLIYIFQCNDCQKYVKMSM